jgi:thioredoxin family protein/tetratricopeptide repeat protein
VYPEARVSQLIVQNFVPVRLHVKKHPEAMGRFNVQWTPTVLILDSEGNERHRIEGYLPADEFLVQLNIGLAHAAFRTNRFADAEKLYRGILDRYPNSEFAPEAQYWAGVSKYKGSNDAGALKQTAEAFKSRYKDSSWAKKASIWA